MQPIRRSRREIQRFRYPDGHGSTPLVIHGSIEREYWRTHYNACNYVQPRFGFRDYEPAYRYGWELRAGYGDADWSAVESDLAAGWPRYRGECRLSWRDAAPAVRDGFLHAGHRLVAA